LTNWAQVAAGGYHTAAVKTDGTLWTWGANGSSFFDGSGQLGTNDIETRFSPVQVGALSNWAQVSAGRFHTASIKTDGTLWTWGSNQNNTNNQPRGQLGDGTAASKSSPVQVGALTNWAQVSAGDYHTASIKTDGTLWTWGFNTQGVLGDGTTISRSSPVQIGSTDWAQVSTGAHTTATKTNGTLWAWGPNTDGQLGDGTGAGKSSPVQIGVLTNWSTAHAGGIHTASIKTDGTLWTWGRNNYGQLGDDTVASRSSPVQVGALTNWGQLSVGGSHNVAIAKS
jgi:alpha-tubulin suppressor-like RCC1 family protein